MARHRRVLVVEDDPGIRNMLGLAIASFGDEPRLADGRGTVDVSGVDVAILDVRLGTGSVIDLLAAQPELRNLPIILASAGDVLEAQRLLPEAHILQKPFDLDALEAALGEAMTSREAGLDA